MIRMCLIAFAMVLPHAAEAQLPKFFEVGVPITAQEAFAPRYGQLVVDALAKTLRKNAEPACLLDKRIVPEQLRAHGEALLVRHGQARLNRMMALVDAAKADAEFVRLAGPRAQEEWRALLTDPAVAEHDRIARPAKLVEIVNGTAETFDRYVLLQRIKLDSFNPLATGDDALLALGEEIADAAIEAVAELRRRNDTPAMRRFDEMSDSAAAALEAAIDQPEMLRYGPVQWMVGLGEDLRAICIVGK